MSDALTDIARDERRAGYYRDYLQKLYEHLRYPSKSSHDKLVEAAERTDSVSRGYWGGKTNLTEGLVDLLQSLTDWDKKAWAKLLLSAKDYNVLLHQKLKEISPFKDSSFILVNYGIGFVNFEDPDGALQEAIKREGMVTYDSDKYLVEVKVDEDTEVIWLGNGYYMPEKDKSPYVKDRKKKR